MNSVYADSDLIGNKVLESGDVLMGGAFGLFSPSDGYTRKKISIRKATVTKVSRSFQSQLKQGIQLLPSA